MDFILDRNSEVELIYDEALDKAVLNAIDSLRLDLKDTLNVSAISGKEDVKTDKPVIRIKLSRSLSHKEEYKLSVKNGVLTLSGRDRRGVIYAIYTFSEEFLKVSPWHFFADVKKRKLDIVRIPHGYLKSDFPSIEYRGIFINDEEELEHWATRYFGEETIGVKTYKHIFELLLRLKLNYLWPAMHVNSFNMLKENGELADSFGIVIGTSHCDMLMRSNNREWKPWLLKKGYTDIEYDYSIPGKNRDKLIEYWRESVEQNKDFEVSYTLGMRGIHDSGFNTKNLQGLEGKDLLNAKIKLLSDVINAQEEIIDSVKGSDEDSLKLFIPYKEVLELYDNGLEVPDDLTLIWVNDNYGHIRRFPSEREIGRNSGNGLYYHNSYWAGAGASYLFIDTIPLAQTRNELKKAYENDIRKLWVTNFGAIKPLEEQLSYYADLAWNINKKSDPTADCEEWLARWLDKTFDKNIGCYLMKELIEFDQIVNARKIEFMDSDVFRALKYDNEAAYRMNRLKKIFYKVNEVYKDLDEEDRPAFFELVLLKVHAAFYTNAMYYFADCSNIEGDNATKNRLASYSSYFDLLRRVLLYCYNNKLLKGKWQGIVTPEDFPPPRTAMNPAAVPGLIQTLRPLFWTAEPDEIDKKDVAYSLAYKSIKEAKVFEAADFKIKAGFEVIPYLGRDHGSLLQSKKGSKACAYIDFSLNKGEYTLLIHRYPSLNSVGELKAVIEIDEESHEIKSISNDEKRGSFKSNVLNSLDLLKLKVSLSEGNHRLTLKTDTPYFAISRIVLYESKHNDGLLLPSGSGVFSEGESFTVSDFSEYESILKYIYKVPKSRLYKEIKPREILTLKKDASGGTLLLEDLVKRPKSPDFFIDVTKKESAIVKYQKKMVREYLKLPKEKNNRITIHAASVLSKSPYVSAESGENARISGDGFTPKGRANDPGFNINRYWQYCLSPSDRGLALSMYIRQRNLSFDSENAPKLSYRFYAEGGNYDLYAYLYFWDTPESFFNIEIDGRLYERKELFEGKTIWRYSGEHVYKWYPLLSLNLVKGEHTVKFISLHSGIRIEKLELIKKKAP